MPDRLLTIGQLAAELGTTVKALRYQIAEGRLVHVSVRPAKGGRGMKPCHLYSLEAAMRLPMRCNRARNQRPLDPDCMTAEEIAERLGTTAAAVRGWCLHALGEYRENGQVRYWHSYRDAEEYWRATKYGGRKLPWQRKEQEPITRMKRGRYGGDGE